MIKNFIFSDDGQDLLWKFYDVFDCRFFIGEPGENVFLETKEKTYIIPPWETVDGIKATAEGSILANENLFIDRYKEYVHTYSTDDILY